jgi:hypothetical protein
VAQAPHAKDILEGMLVLLQTQPEVAVAPEGQDVLVLQLILMQPIVALKVDLVDFGRLMVNIMGEEGQVVQIIIHNFQMGV